MASKNHSGVERGPLRSHVDDDEDVRRDRQQADLEIDHTATNIDEHIDISQQVGHLLRKAYQRHTAIFQDICFDRQLTSVQLAALCTIDIHGASSLREVGRAAALDPATARGVVDRLRDRGLVALSADPNDKRKVVVDLEEEGRRLVQAMVPYSAEISKRTTQSLNPAEKVALVYLLQKIAK